MSLLDFLKRDRKERAERLTKQLVRDVLGVSDPHRRRRSSESRSRSRLSSAPRRQTILEQWLDPREPGRWIPRGESSRVDRPIPGGMLYIGNDLRSVNSVRAEPALINPELPAVTGNPAKLGDQPAYDTLSSRQRNAYLDWLSRGRSTPPNDVGFAKLFIYGLERRAFGELAGLTHDAAWREFQLIRSEAGRIASLCQGLSAPFDATMSRLLDALDLLIGRGLAMTRFSVPTGVAQELPISVRVTTAQYAAQARPLPVEWAWALANAQPQVSWSSANERIRGETRALFGRRYRQTYGAGVVVPPVQRPLKITYRPLNPHINPVSMQADTLTDVADSAIGGQLGDMIVTAQRDLERYRRASARDNELSLKVLAMLPAELLTPTLPALTPMATWLKASIDGPRAIFPASKLLAHWAHPAPDKLTKADATAFLTILDALGYGVEPDVRHGGAAMRADNEIVIFLLPDGSEPTLSDGFPAARALVHLSAAVLSADGAMTDVELHALGGTVAASHALTTGERARLAAYLAWISRGPIPLTGLKAKLAALTEEQRASIGTAIVHAASSDGQIVPDEVAALGNIYALLGIDRDRVTSDLHQAITGGRHRRSSATSLDPTLIARKQRETAAVSTLLADIFADDTPEPLAPTPSPPTSLPGLDARFAPFAIAVCADDAWTRSDLDALAKTHSLLPAGAIDAVNEWAIDATGEPLLEGDDPIAVNHYVRKELLP